LPYSSIENQRTASRLGMRRVREKKKLQGNTDLQSFLDSIKGCTKCELNPSVFVTFEKIGVCIEQWKILAESDIEWESERQ